MNREGLCEEMDVVGMEPRKLCVAGVEGWEGQCSRPRPRSHTLGSFGGGKEGYCAGVREPGEDW